MNIGITRADYEFSKWIRNLTVVDQTFREDYDLIIFPGGADVSPLLYGQQNTKSSCNLPRDKWEISVFKAYKERAKFLGVCRGHQLLNVLTGGILSQDITSELFVSHPNMHEIIDVNGGEIPKIFGNLVNSTHHQGVIIPGNGQKVTSMFRGIIESTESEKIITMQWHPEFFDLNYKRSINLFNYILEWAEL